MIRFLLKNKDLSHDQADLCNLIAWIGKESFNEIDTSTSILLIPN